MPPLEIKAPVVRRLLLRLKRFRLLFTPGAPLRDPLALHLLGAPGLLAAARCRCCARDDRLRSRKPEANRQQTTTACALQVEKRASQIEKFALQAEKCALQVEIHAKFWTILNLLIFIARNLPSFSELLLTNVCSVTNKKKNFLLWVCTRQCVLFQWRRGKNWRFLRGAQSGRALAAGKAHRCVQKRKGCQRLQTEHGPDGGKCSSSELDQWFPSWG